MLYFPFLEVAGWGGESSPGDKRIPFLALKAWHPVIQESVCVTKSYYFHEYNINYLNDVQNLIVNIIEHTSQPRHQPLPIFLCVSLKNWEWPGNEAACKLEQTNFD